MSDHDLVSVVIPAYNHERYVGETLKSIIDQTYRNIELIIVNDGSTDGTHSQIEAQLPACRERFQRTEYLNKDNEGVIKTLNRCLAMATGSYVYFIASDDVAEPNAIEMLHDFLYGHPGYGLAVGDNALIDAEGRVCYWGRKQETIYDKDMAYAFTFADYLQKRNPDLDFNGPDFGSYTLLLGGNHVPNGFMIRKNILDKIGGYSDIAPLEDLHLMLQIAKHTRLKYIDQVLFRYRWHDANTIRQRERMKRYLKQTLELEIPYAREHGLLDLIPREKTLKVLGIKLCEIKKSQMRTKILFCGLCIYQNSRRKNRDRIEVLGIPIWVKKQSDKQSS